MHKVHGFSWIEVLMSVSVISSILLVSFLMRDIDGDLYNYRKVAMSKELQGNMNELYLLSRREPEQFRNLLEMAIGEPIALQAQEKGCGDVRKLEEGSEFFTKLNNKYSGGFELGVSSESLYLRSCERISRSDDYLEIDLDLKLFID